MPTAVSDLATLVHAGDYAAIQDVLLHLTPREAAEAILALPPAHRPPAFAVLPHRPAAAVFEYMPEGAQRELSDAMGPREAAAILNLVADDDRTKFLSELPPDTTRHILALLTPDESAEAATLLKYPRGVVGRLMTMHYIAVGEHWTVGEVLDFVRAHGQDSETLNVIYVVDESGVLIDDIRIRELLVVPLERKMSDLMDRRFVVLHASDSQEEALKVFRREDRTALPVVDDKGVLVGIVTVDDILDVASDTATREMQRFGGSEALDEPYMHVDARSNGEEARRLACGAFSRRDADGHRDGLLREGNREGRGAGAVRAAHHLERRQLRVTGVHAGDSCVGGGRSDARGFLEA